ncbi:MAG: response regulator [Lautropia sp.]
MSTTLTRRPVVRIASAGLDPRDVRLIQIVFEHSQYNKYDYRMLDVLDLTQTDILIANPADPAGLDAMSAVGARARARAIPTVAAVPRGAQTSARHSIAIDRLTLQLLPILNRVVERENIELGAVDVPPLSDELTDIHTDAQPADPVRAATVGTATATDAPAAAAGSGTIDPAGGRSAQRLPPPPQVRSLEPLASGRVAEVIARATSRAAEVAAAHASEVAEATAAAASRAAGRTAGRTAERAADRGGAEPGADSATVTAPAAPRMPYPVDPGPATRPINDDPPQGERRAQPRPAPPSAERPVDPLPAAEARAAPSYTAPRLRLLALAVAPSPVAQQQMKRALRRIGLEVQCAVGSAAAIQLASRQYYDLVVCEQGLTDGDGFDLIRRMRQIPAYRFTPVLLVRSRSQPLDSARARLAGDVVLLTKPLSRGALEHVVRDTLRHTVIVDDLNELLVPADSLR